MLEMFSSSSNIHEPFAYTNQTYDQNPNSRSEESLSSLLHFPCPFLDYDDDQLLVNNNNEKGSKVGDEERSMEVMNTKKRRQGVKQPRKKPVKKKDRHSKIRTAQGLRDRRMRLSLQIARNFFDLQDMLGFDKASKTVEWLFLKSKSAIKELAGNRMGLSSVDESESMMDLSTNKKKSKLPKKTCNSLAKEMRNRARERARERTREKMMIKGLEESRMEGNPNLGLGLGLGFSSPLEGAEKSVFGSQEINWEMQSARVESSYCATGNVQLQTPSLIFMDRLHIGEQNPNPVFVPNWHAYEQNPSSILMISPNVQNQNPSSKFMTTSNSQQDPSSIFTATSNICFQSHDFQENQFPCN